MKQRFFKLNSRWYADAPGHILDENEMICGADTLLDEISELFKTNDFSVDIDTLPCNSPFATLIQVEHDDNGATYRVYSILSTPLICISNVAHDILGEHPKKFYINKINI